MSGPGLTGADYGAGAGGGGLITSSTPVAPPVGGQFGPLRSGFVTGASGSQQTQATEANLVADYGRMTSILRKSLAQQLKSAGFKVPVTGRYSIKVRDAFVSASQALSDEIRGLAAQDPTRLTSTKYDLTTFLKDLSTTERIGVGGADKTPTTVQSITEYRPETIADLINKVSFDLTGEAASQNLIAKYTRSIERQLKQPGNIQQTTYTPKTDGVQKQITQEGFSPERFLIEEISKGDAAKASSVMSFYEVFDRAIGRNNG